MVPDLFIRVQIGTIGGQILDYHIALACGLVALHRAASVIAGAIGNDDNRASRIGPELFEKFDKTRAIHATLEALKFHVATGADSADQLQTKRSPLSVTAGVFPILPQVVPRWASERTTDSSTK